MANAPVFTADVEGPSTEKRRSGWQTCLIGCLIVGVILLVLAILVGVWVARNMRDWAAMGVTEVVRQGMAESQLPAQEQQEVMVQVERLATAFREKQITLEEVGVVAQKLAESPLMSLIGASMIEQQYLAKSGLSDEEKAEDSQILQRFIRGSIDGDITEERMDAAMVHVAERRNGNWELKQQLTDDELRAFFAEAKKQADEAGIPEQPADIDPSEEIKKIVVEALAAPAA
jgi:hypothetical protein